MKILLDSHALVWFLNGDRRCSARARKAIEDVATTVYVSAVCAWELATKVRIGKWPEAAALADRLPEIMIASDFEPMPITVEHGRIAGFLSGLHRDPFDRMLAAQAQVEGLRVVTADPVFQTFGTSVLW